MSDLSDNLELLRKDRKYTRKQIAELIDVPWHTYKGWELGSYLPNLPNLIKICKIYNVSLDELAGLKKLKESNLIHKPEDKDKENKNENESEIEKK